jgi:hypothetical protein
MITLTKRRHELKVENAIHNHEGNSHSKSGRNTDASGNPNGREQVRKPRVFTLCGLAHFPTAKVRVSQPPIQSGPLHS